MGNMTVANIESRLLSEQRLNFDLLRENRLLRAAIEQAKMDMVVVVDCMSKQDKHLCTECKDRLTRALEAKI